MIAWKMMHVLIINCSVACFPMMSACDMTCMRHMRQAGRQADTHKHSFLHPPALLLCSATSTLGEQIRRIYRIYIRYALLAPYLAYRCLLCRVCIHHVQVCQDMRRTSAAASSRDLDSRRVRAATSRDFDASSSACSCMNTVKEVWWARVGVRGGRRRVRGWA